VGGKPKLLRRAGRPEGVPASYRWKGVNRVKNWTKASTAGVLALAMATLAAGTAKAAIPIYPNVNTENPVTYQFNAAADGDLIAYFAGNSGSFSNVLGLLVNGVDSGITGLESLTATEGQQLNFGQVAQGDSLVFYIHVNPNEDNDNDPSNDRFFYSDKSRNFDGVNHVFSAPYTGGDFGIPAGTYVSFEDLDGGGDFNYKDLDFVFSNVTTISTGVPEPATWAMTILGIGFTGAALRQRNRTKLRFAF
jgi:hypothetical protein